MFAMLRAVRQQQEAQLASLIALTAQQEDLSKRLTTSYLRQTHNELRLRATFVFLAVLHKISPADQTLTSIFQSQSPHLEGLKFEWLEGSPTNPAFGCLVRIYALPSEMSSPPADEGRFILIVV